jgi:hypothetical protein
MGGKLPRFNSPDQLGGHVEDPQSWNRYSYARNNPLKYVDPDGKCSAPAVGKGQVGVCFEAFISTKWVGGIGRGDNRGFSGTDARLTSRFEVKFTVDTATGNASAPETWVGESDVLVKGLGRAGTAFTTLKTNYADDSGSSFTLGVSALNGLASLPGAPKSPIDAEVNFMVTPDGKVGIGPGSKLDGYPSFGAYAYKPGQANTPIILLENPENQIEDLPRRMRTIQTVEPR